jgi:ribonuclease HI
MEVQAALDAMRSIAGPLQVVSDSTYVVNCVNNRWYVGWLRNGWRNSQKQPVANRELWEPFVAIITGDPGRVVFKWVKGHGRNAGNNLVDALAVEASHARRGWDGPLAP